MCGIAGFWSAGKLEPNAEKLLADMISTLHHRGPDGFGFHADTDVGLAVGHARLSIIDLETGHQPLFGPKRKTVLTANGEFYDYKRIRAQLTCLGSRFQTKSDSEIALHLYERDGLDFIDHLRGEFAFALFDTREDRLILGRDRFGIKPLYYHISNDTIYYASEIKALFAHPRVPRRLCRRAVLHQLMHTTVPGATAFEDIHALEPGHMLIINRRDRKFDIRKHRYWDMDFPREDERDLSIPAETHIQAVRDKLIESVSLRLEADVPVGCYLSGGIDSCSMLGLASGVQQSPVKAYTISFDDDTYDEAEIAREMAQRVNAQHDILNLTAAELYGDNYTKTLWHAERTFYNTLGVAKWCMSRRVHESGYKTVVTGEGADEMFAGYAAFKQDMLLHGHRSSSEEEIRSYQEAMDRFNEHFKGAILSEEKVSHPAFDSLCGFTPSWIQPWMMTLKVSRPLLHDDILDELKDYDPIEAIAGALDPEQIKGRHFLDIAQYTWIKTMLECQILNWGGDRVDMANSMESRPAFLDHHLAEIARLIPPHMRIRGGTEKWVLREAMRGVLPDVLYRREKFAFMAPPAHREPRKRQAVQKLIREHMSPEHIRAAGLFDETRVRNLIEEYERNEDPVVATRHDIQINHLLCLHLLHQQFIEKAA